MSAGARNALLDYDWPLNVRELENVVCRLVAFAENDEEIGKNRVFEEIGGNILTQKASLEGNRFMVIDSHLPYNEAKDELAKLLIIKALNETTGNLGMSATKLGMSIPGLRSAIKRLGIKPINITVDK